MARNFADMSTSTSISPDQKVPVTTHNGESACWKSPERHFVGLYNPGATCYMNSLLQTLFMTPEFRLKLYSFQYDKQTHGRPENCIPYQLQLLFGRLQLSHFASVETTDLIQSFQWDTSDTFIQHDAQEFCRILFDAIEISVKDCQPLATMIQDLYGGTLVDYLQCLGCGNESSREDSFLDLSLTVRSDGDNLYNNSVEKAIASYLSAEHLHDENQVFCEKCGRKEDSVKGFKLKSLPYILMLQLKRFDLDVTLMQRRKLNDLVTFPQVLNMNPFFSSHNVRAKSSSQSSDSDVYSPVMSPVDVEDLKLTYVLTSTSESVISDIERNPLRMDAIALRRLRERHAHERRERTWQSIREYQAEGDHVYELFSVMVHSGSSLGGHYYAYIKCFENYRWYDFDDSRVTEIDDEDLEKAFGGENSIYGTSAYLLMYRKVCSENLETVENAQIPAEIMSVIEQDALAPGYDQIVNILVFAPENGRCQIAVQKTSTFEELKRRVMEMLHIAKDPSLFSIWNYEPHYAVLLEPLDENPERKIEDVHQGADVKFVRLAPRESPFDPTQIHVQVVLPVDIANSPEVKYDTAFISSPRSALVSDFIAKTSEKLGVPQLLLVLLQKRKAGFFDLTQDSATRSKTLTQALIFDGQMLYAEDTRTPHHWMKVFTEGMQRFWVRFNDPTSDSNSDADQEAEPPLHIARHEHSVNLREKIAKKLGLEPTNIVLRKFGKNGPEIKDNSEVDAPRCLCVHVEIGEAALSNQFRLSLDLAEPGNEYDSQWYVFTPLGQQIILQTATIADLKDRVNMHALLAPRMLTSSDFCIRERLADRLGQVYDPALPLEDCIRSERKRLAVQILSSAFPLQLHMQTIPIAYRVWDPTSYELSSAKDVWVYGDMRTEDLARVLARIVHIAVARLEVCRIAFPGGFSRLHLWRARWHSLEPHQSAVTAFPLFLTSRGGFLVLKDASKAVAQPTDREYRLYSYRPLPRVVEPLHSRFKERSIKITVKVEKPN